MGKLNKGYVSFYFGGLKVRPLAHDRFTIKFKRTRRGLVPTALTNITVHWTFIRPY